MSGQASADVALAQVERSGKLVVVDAVVDLLVPDAPGRDTAHQIASQLVEANEIVAPPEESRPFAVVARTRHGVIGGAVGHTTHEGWLFVDHFALGLSSGRRSPEGARQTAIDLSRPEGVMTS